MRGMYVPSLNFKYGCFGILGKDMALSVFNPSLRHLLPFHQVLCHYFKVMLFVGI